LTDDPDHAPSRRQFLRKSAQLALAGSMLTVGGDSRRSPEPAGNPRSPTKFLLLSNGNGSGVPPGRGYLEYAGEWIQNHFSASPQSPKTVLYIPHASNPRDWAQYTRDATRIFARWGIRIVSGETPSDFLTLLNKADGVFVDGGNTFRLLNALQRDGLLAPIRDKVKAGLPYLGSSAGTVVACPTIKTTNDMPIIHPSSLDALNLVPFQINAHYVDGQIFYRVNGAMTEHKGESREKRISEFHEIHNSPVIGLREGSALSIRGHRVELLGAQPAKLFRKGMAPVELHNGRTLSELLEREEARLSSTGR
jgi:dipeptidase E